MQEFSDKFKFYHDFVTKDRLTFESEGKFRSEPYSSNI